MNAKVKATYRMRFREFFDGVRTHPIYEKIMILPSSLRISLAFLLFLFGIIGALTPIPFGLIFIGIAVTLVFGIREAKRYSIRLFFILRIHKLLHFLKYKILR